MALAGRAAGAGLVVGGAVAGVVTGATGRGLAVVVTGFGFTVVDVEVDVDVDVDVVVDEVVLDVVGGGGGSVVSGTGAAGAEADAPVVHQTSVAPAVAMTASTAVTL